MHVITIEKPITRIELHKEVGGKLKLVDYGVESQVDSYIKQGYTVVRRYNQERRIV